MKRHVACGVCVLVLLACLRGGAASFCLQTLLLVAYLKLQSTRSEIIECIVCGFVSMFFVVPLTLVMCWPSPHAAAVPAGMTISMITYHVTKHKVSEVATKHREDDSFSL